MRCSSARPCSRAWRRPRDRRWPNGTSRRRRRSTCGPPRIAGLQIGDVHRAAAAGQRLRLGLLVVDERDDRTEIGGAQRERRHALVRAPGANAAAPACRRARPRRRRGARQVGTRLAAHRVAAVTEAALRGEEPLPCRDLIGGVGLRCRRPRRRHRRRARLSPSLGVQERAEEDDRRTDNERRAGPFRLRQGYGDKLRRAGDGASGREMKRIRRLLSVQCPSPRSHRSSCRSACSPPRSRS